jgi:Tol biopolymer transport system component
MLLITGARLGPYEILSALGAGGMGEVYRARDGTLQRDVALKILPELFALNTDRLARFRREAQVLASLNHPNIAAIYGFEESTSVHALVLELVEGPTLADRVAQGPIPLNEALPIARQIAEALETAHEQGVIHRDLKPANIKLRSDGTIKVLDFGLAKLNEPNAPSVPNQSLSPTITSPAMMTGVGMILGTAAYMAPEQARGKAVDKRVDIWAFGVVLYEMLAGRPLFGAEEVSDTIAAVLKTEPDWKALPPSTPADLRRLLTRCLNKDHKARLRDVGEARLQIEQLLDGVPEATQLPQMTLTPARWQRALPWASAGALAAGLAIVVMAWAPWRTTPRPVPVQLRAALGVDAAVIAIQSAPISISADGHLLVFAAQKPGAVTQLYVRRLGELTAAPLAGTDGASSPALSPDGRWIGFIAGGKLKRISVTGGTAITIADAPTARGVTWSDDGMAITFSPHSNVGLFEVSSDGGRAEPLTTLGDGQFTHRWPQILPGGSAVLFTAHTSPNGFDTANVEAQPLPTGARRILQRGATYGRYLRSGHLVYLREGTLFAAPFDPERLELTSPGVRILEGVATTPAGAAGLAVSDNGTLVYVPGRSADRQMPVDWIGREGKVTPLRTMPANWSNLVFAPDGRRLALDIADGEDIDVWTYEWERDSLSRLTLISGSATKPVWTPDGKRIVFGSVRSDTGRANLYWQRADNTGTVQRLTDSNNGQGAWSWHPSGKFLAFHELNPQTQDDVFILPVDGDEVSGWKPGKPVAFLNSPHAERAPMFSPDGRWVAYQSTESGRDDVYVRPFPGPGSQEKVSTGGGSTPTWSRTRPELLFATPDGRIMVAPYTEDGDAFRPETPRPWADSRLVARPRIGATRSFDLHPDGNRLALAAMTDTQADAQPDTLVFVFNFFEHLRRMAPAR